MNSRLLLISLALVLFSSLAFAGCVPITNWGCSSNEKCIYQAPATTFCQPLNLTDQIANFINSISISGLLCSTGGALAGICSSVVGLFIIPLIAGLLIAIILSILAWAYFGVPPNWIVFGIGALIGIFLGAVVNTWWWVIVIIGVVLYFVFKALNN